MKKSSDAVGTCVFGLCISAACALFSLACLWFGAWAAECLNKTWAEFPAVLTAVVLGVVSILLSFVFSAAALSVLKDDVKREEQKERKP